jgi:hypothetical protein
MMDWILEILWTMVKLWTRRTLKESFRGSLHKRALLVYLTAIKSFRGLLLVVIATFVFLQVMIFGFVGCVYSVVQLLPISQELRIWVLLGVSGVCLLLPVFFLTTILSERFLFRMSGGEKLFEELTADSNHRQ